MASARTSLIGRFNVLDSLLRQMACQGELAMAVITVLTGLLLFQSRYHILAGYRMLAATEEGGDSAPAAVAVQVFRTIAQPQGALAFLLHFRAGLLLETAASIAVKVMRLPLPIDEGMAYFFALIPVGPPSRGPTSTGSGSTCSRGSTSSRSCAPSSSQKCSWAQRSGTVAEERRSCCW